MSALGQKRTFALHQPMSALPPKADIYEDKLLGHPVHRNRDLQLPTSQDR